MKFIKLVFFVLFLVLGAAQFSYSQNKDEAPAVDEFVARQAKEKNAKEYRYAREIVRGDINGDGRNDLAVLYTLNGFRTGLSDIRYLAIFINDGKNLIYADSLAVSGIIDRQINFKPIENGVVILDTLEYYRREKIYYRIVGKKSFTLTAGKLKETQSEN